MEVTNMSTTLQSTEHFFIKDLLYEFNWNLDIVWERIPVRIKVKFDNKADFISYVNKKFTRRK